MTSVLTTRHDPLTVDWSSFGPHRPLADTAYRVWGVGLLRSAGFPVSGLGWSSGERAAAAAGTGTFVAAYEADGEAESAALARVAGDEALRTAVAWQNRSVYAILDRLAARDPQKPMKRRQRERALAMYWQRYCSKAETIGFFGPAAWLAVGGATEAVTLRTGPALVGRRTVSFEHWMIAEIAGWMAEQPGARWWFPPVLRPDVHLVGEQLLVPGRGPIRLRDGDREVLALADGRHHGADIAAAVRRDRAPVERVLTKYLRLRLLAWDGNIPVNDRGERTLRERVDRIGDPDVFTRFDALLRRLAELRTRIEAADGSDGLIVALDELDELFRGITGHASTRDGGKSYAGRTLCYHDTVRGCALTLGTDFTDRIGRPLALVASAADWFGGRLADLVEEAVAQIVRTAAATARGPVTLADVWVQVLGLFWGADPHPVRCATAELARKWSDVLGDLPSDLGTPVTLRSHEIAGRVAEAFGTAPNRWPHLAVHSPDLQVVAASADAVNAGDYTVVLGELHACLSSLDLQFLDWTAPGTESLRDRTNAAIGAPRSVPLFPRGWRRNSGRFVPTSVGAADRLIGFSRAAVADRTTVDAAVSITLTERDGTVFATRADGCTVRIPDLLGVLVSMVAADAFKIGLDHPHSPRLSVDGMVVFRESWRLPLTSLQLAVNADRHRDYLAVRDWADRHGLPDQVFVKFPDETKPALFDLTSPTLVLSFVNLARASLRHGPDAVVGLSEPLPHPRDSWLVDAEGEHYISELRLQISRETST